MQPNNAWNYALATVPSAYSSLYCGFPGKLADILIERSLKIIDVITQTMTIM